MKDIKNFAARQAQSLRASAGRFELRGDSATATMFRNDAWHVEHDTTGLDDVQIREERKDQTNGS